MSRYQKRGQRRGLVTRLAVFVAHAQKMEPIIKRVEDDLTLNWQDGGPRVSDAAIARALNDLGHQTANGSIWRSNSVSQARGWKLEAKRRIQKQHNSDRHDLETARRERGYLADDPEAFAKERDRLRATMEADMRALGD